MKHTVELDDGEIQDIVAAIKCEHWVADEHGLRGNEASQIEQQQALERSKALALRLGGLMTPPGCEADSGWP